MRTLYALLATTALSASLSCELPRPTLEAQVEPDERSERIAWRARIGIDAAKAYVFDDCGSIGRLRQAFEEYGEPYDLSSRDIAESVFWGVYHHRDELEPSDAETLSGYIEERLDEHGERILETVDILFGEGDYDSTVHWYIYEPMKNQISDGVESVGDLRRRIDGGLVLARLFTDLEGMYAEMRSSWE